ncbi:DUF5993 family protein [Pseudomonas chlororaphis]
MVCIDLHKGKLPNVYVSTILDCSVERACHIFREKAIGFCLWGLLLIVSIVWFNYHSTDSLTLSF